MSLRDATNILVDVLSRCAVANRAAQEMVFDCSPSSPVMQGCIMWTLNKAMVVPARAQPQAAPSTLYHRRFFLIPPPRLVAHYGDGNCFPPQDYMDACVGSDRAGHVCDRCKVPENEPKLLVSGSAIGATCTAPRSFMYVFSGTMIREDVAAPVLEKSVCISHAIRFQ
jgi:hypothetical protein